MNLPSAIGHNDFDSWHLLYIEKTLVSGFLTYRYIAAKKVHFYIKSVQANNLPDT